MEDKTNVDEKVFEKTAVQDIPKSNGKKTLQDSTRDRPFRPWFCCATSSLKRRALVSQGPKQDLLPIHRTIRLHHNFLGTWAHDLDS